MGYILISSESLDLLGIIKSLIPQSEVFDDYHVIEQGQNNLVLGFNQDAETKVHISGYDKPRTGVSNHPQFIEIKSKSLDSAKKFVGTDKLPVIRVALEAQYTNHVSIKDLFLEDQEEYSINLERTNFKYYNDVSQYRIIPRYPMDSRNKPWFGDVLLLKGSASAV